jgi:hypothetical protein
MIIALPLERRQRHEASGAQRQRLAMKLGCPGRIELLEMSCGKGQQAGLFVRVLRVTRL